LKLLLKASAAAESPAGTFVPFTHTSAPVPDPRKALCSAVSVAEGMSKA
jgi:hypothetical protein